jgi:hypothetical protein
MKKAVLFTQILVLTSILWVPELCFAQTDLKVVKTDGSELVYNISETGKLYFDETNLIIDEDGDFVALASILRSEIRKLVFGNYTGIENTLAEKSPAVYPNPATNQLIIDCGQLTFKKVEIVDIAGKKTGNYRLSIFNAQLHIDISGLPAGFYLIKLDNQTHKFVKK